MPLLHGHLRFRKVILHPLYAETVKSKIAILPRFYEPLYF